MTKTTNTKTETLKAQLRARSEYRKARKANRAAGRDAIKARLAVKAAKRARDAAAADQAEAAFDYFADKITAEQLADARRRYDAAHEALVATCTELGARWPY